MTIKEHANVFGDGPSPFAKEGEQYDRNPRPDPWMQEEEELTELDKFGLLFESYMHDWERHAMGEEEG